MATRLQSKGAWDAPDAAQAVSNTGAEPAVESQGVHECTTASHTIALENATAEHGRSVEAGHEATKATPQATTAAHGDGCSGVVAYDATTLLELRARARDEAPAALLASLPEQLLRNA